VAIALEGRGQPGAGDLLGQARADDPRAHRQHVGVVVGSGQARGVQAVAQASAHTGHLVGGELLALAAAAQHDAALGAAVGDLTGDVGADRRVVDRFGAVSAAIVDLVALAGQPRHEMALEGITRMI
jgi:hypothetical protein